MLELARARPRRERVGADHERERVGGVDPELDLGHPLRGGSDVLPVDPHLLLAPDEAVDEVADELLVLPRVGDEKVSHGAPLKYGVAAVRWAAVATSRLIGSVLALLRAP